MPTYQYACTDCAERLEVVQRFSDDPLTVCPSCGGKLRKVFSPVGIVFKGSGFYRTDSRGSQKSEEPAKTSANGSDSKKSESTSSSDSGSGSGSKDSSGKSDKKSGDSGGKSSSKSSSSSTSSGSKVA